MAVSFRIAGAPYAGLGVESVAVEIAGEVGDLVLLVCNIRGGLVFATPDGWSLVSTYTISFYRQAVFSRIKQPGDTTVVVTTTVPPASSQTEIAQTFAFAGCDAVIPGQPFISNVGSMTIGPIPGVVVPVDGAAVVVGGMVNDWDSINTLSGDGLVWQKIGDQATTAGGDGAQTVDCAANGLGVPVDVAEKTWVFVGAATAGKGGVMLSLAPSATPPDPTPPATRAGALVVGPYASRVRVLDASATVAVAPHATKVVVRG